MMVAQTKVIALKKLCTITNSVYILNAELSKFANGLDEKKKDQR